MITTHTTTLSAIRDPSLLNGMYIQCHHHYITASTIMLSVVIDCLVSYYCSYTMSCLGIHMTRFQALMSPVPSMFRIALGFLRLRPRLFRRRGLDNCQERPALIRAHARGELAEKERRCRFATAKSERKQVLLMPGTLSSHVAGTLSSHVDNSSVCFLTLCSGGCP